MDILRSIEELQRIQTPLVLAAGVFDGMHLGHRAVLEAAIKTSRRIEASPVVLTFDPHPASVLRPEAPVPLLTPPDIKLQLIAATGISHTLVVPFDRRFSMVEPEEFLSSLTKASNQLAGICIGQGWRFGRDRRGDPDLLRVLGMQSGFFTSEVPAVRIEGRTVSSTLIRQALAAGDIETANRYLGRVFTVSGKVVKGAQLGSRLGFPTANVVTDERQYPADGVYVIKAQSGGRHLRGVANIGVRPTVQSAATRILEAHLFDFEGDLYASELEISFLHRLRAEKKFDGIEALQAHIVRDCAEAREWFQRSGPSR